MRAECAAYALATREPYGVWGGFTEQERHYLLREGWQDTWRGRQVDVSLLEARLRDTHWEPSDGLGGQVMSLTR